MPTAAKGKARRSRLRTSATLNALAHKAAAKRRKRAPLEEAFRDSVANASQERRVARRETIIRRAVARVKAIERHPSAFGLCQLADMLARRELPEEARVLAARVLLRLGDRF